MRTAQIRLDNDEMGIIIFFVCCDFFVLNFLSFISYLKVCSSVFFLKKKTNNKFSWFLFRSFGGNNSSFRYQQGQSELIGLLYLCLANISSAPFQRTDARQSKCLWIQQQSFFQSAVSWTICVSRRNNNNSYFRKRVSRRVFNWRNFNSQRFWIRRMRTSAVWRHRTLLQMCSKRMVESFLLIILISM